MRNVQTFIHTAPAIKHQPTSHRYYFDVGIGSVCLSGADTGGAYCLLEVSLAPGMMVPRHTHTREDEAYYVLSGELEIVVGERPAGRPDLDRSVSVVPSREPVVQPGAERPTWRW